MAKLIPNSTYRVNGVNINEKIIPDGLKWKSASKAKSAGFAPGALYKKQQKLNKNSGVPLYITIHNTSDLNNVNDDGEQYTRATYNENMGSVRVHFYVDDICAWQNLKAGTGMISADPLNGAEVSWHAGDGSTSNGGNMTSLSIEIIMNDNEDHDAKAYDNGARLAAWLLWKHGLDINKLVTHTYWVNKSAGKHFANIDEQCTSKIEGKKWCPLYIFKSSNQKIALENWKTFKNITASYLTTLCEPNMYPNSPSAKIKPGDLVSISEEARYYTGAKIPEWVKKQRWYVKEIVGDRAVINANESSTNEIMSPVHIKYLNVAKTKEPTNTPYLIKVMVDSLTIRKLASANSEKTGTITDRGVYTIVDEVLINEVYYGKLKSGAGWVDLSYTKRL